MFIILRGYGRNKGTKSVNSLVTFAGFSHSCTKGVNRMLNWSRGVRLPSYKEPAASHSIAACAPEKPVLTPLAYGDVPPCRLAAEPGASLKRGGVLGLPREEGGAPVVAPVSGVLQEVRTVAHPVFGDLPCAVLLPEKGQVPAAPAYPEASGVKSKPQAVIEAARLAGILDELDGVPLYLKLQDWQSHPVDAVVVDASEAEPYASSAWAVLNESAEEVYEGLKLAAGVAGTARYHIAVQLPGHRLRPLAQRLGEGALYKVRRKYPADKLIDLPANAAVCRLGTQAALALYRAAAFEEPQTQGVVTVAGDAVAKPQNVRIPFGITADDVLRFCGLSAEPQYVILGDAMTGVAAESTDVPLLPGITCLLALTSRPVPQPRPCMGCGRCARVCHAGLLPYEIVRRLENMHYERLPSLLPEECDGCGACSHVCPAGRDVTAKVLEAKQTQGTIFLNWGDDDDA